VYDSATYDSELKKVGGETVVDIFATKTVHKWEGTGTLSLKGEIRNIGNSKHEGFTNYPLPGRSFWLGLRYDY
jgi:vitamin B12 transporter